MSSVFPPYYILERFKHYTPVLKDVVYQHEPLTGPVFFRFHHMERAYLGT
jgi:hypothetical protein